MPILKIQDFNKLVSSKIISPVYLFVGEEFYLIDLCLSKIEQFLTADDLNKEIFYASESSAEDILNALQTFPFLSERKVIIVKGTNKIKAVDAERLTGYLSNIIETSCLILLYSDNYKKETVAKRKEFINKCIASKNCIAVDCRKQYENEVKVFIKNEFDQRDKIVSHDVISRIVNENGTDLLNISNEIEKLSLFVGKNKKDITQNDFEKISGYTKEVNIYSLSSNIEAKDLKKTIFILEKLLSEGEEPVMILSAISSAVRKMLNAKSMIEEQGISVDDTASALRIHSFYAGSFFANLKKHNTKKLKINLKTILQADISIKTGNSDATSALEKNILSICN
ncbi:MAG: DNA polymerase III subunit delta [Endomicrobium sp.]|jgi:DNA polymerase-3 subunit delta|nr:DNA polymerase III subunit delta [Endomicrobium sp.]